MKKKYLLLAISILIAIFLALTYAKTVLFAQEYAHAKDTNNILVVLNELNSVWQSGDIEGDNKCKLSKNVDNLFYQCNPKYFSCLIENKLINKKIKKHNIDFNISSEYRYNQRTNHREYVYSSSVNDSRFNISLLDTCHEAYLPNRFYPFLVNERKHTYEWDNHGKNIFIDKYLVRAYEIRDYAIQANKKNLIKQFNGARDEDIATNLSVDDMDGYCNYQGKQVLTAQIYDAATIYPEDISDSRSRLFRAPFYPWSRKNSDTEIFKIQKNQKINFKDNEKTDLCSKVYSKDCLSLDFKHYDRNNVTWIGVYETMGGLLEYLPNTLFPTENIKLSSKYFSWDNLYHRVSMRGYWDEEGFNIGNFNFKGIEEVLNSDDFKVAFRCMRSK